jgi:tripartite-type tricarboxylate transporter receptor subunit TctC
VTKEPAFVDRMTDIGTVPIGDTPEQFRATVQFELQRWQKIVRDAGIKLE